MPLTITTLDQARKLIAIAREQDAKDNVLLYDGDHWGDGRFWVGPTLADPVEMAKVQKALVSKNVVKEVCQRHTAGVVGKEPRWSVGLRRSLKEGSAPTPEEQMRIDMAEAILTEWWDERRGHQILQEATIKLLLSSRAVLRLFIPSGLLVDGAIVIPDVSDTTQALQTALDHLFLHVTELHQAAVAVDKTTMRPTAIYVYKDDSGKEFMELAYIEGKDTVLRVIEAGKAEVEEVYRFPFDGKLPLYQMNRDLLITPQVRQQQCLLNEALTMLGRNVVIGGFLERIILNADPPGQWVVDPVTQERTFVPGSIRLGPGTTNYIGGAVVVGEDGKTTVANPSVVYRDPVEVKTFIDTIDTAYRGMLEETHQVHAVQTGAFNISGESRIQARADYGSSLNPTKTDIDRAGRWLLEALLAKSSALAGLPGYFADLRVTFECQLDLGPIPADQQQQVVVQYEKELLDQPTAMIRLGTADPDPMIASINAHREEKARANSATLTSAVFSARELAKDAMPPTASGLLQQAGE